MDVIKLAITNHMVRTCLQTFGSRQAVSKMIKIILPFILNLNTIEGQALTAFLKTEFYQRKKKTTP